MTTSVLQNEKRERGVREEGQKEKERERKRQKIRDVRVAATRKKASQQVFCHILSVFFRFLFVCLSSSGPLFVLKIAVAS